MIKPPGSVLCSCVLLRRTPQHCISSSVMTERNWPTILSRGKDTFLVPCEMPVVGMLFFINCVSAHELELLYIKHSNL